MFRLEAEQVVDQVLHQWAEVVTALLTDQPTAVVDQLWI